MVCFTDFNLPLSENKLFCNDSSSLLPSKTSKENALASLPLFFPSFSLKCSWLRPASQAASLQRHSLSPPALPTPPSLLPRQCQHPRQGGGKGFQSSLPSSKPFPRGQGAATGPGQERGAGSRRLTSENLTRPSRKEQSAALWVQMWRYLHQWQGKEPFTQDRQLRRERRGQR